MTSPDILRAFHVMATPMRIMAELIRNGRTADGVMKIMANQDAALVEKIAGVTRNDTCPCGSGIKFKKCHWQK